MFCAKEKLLSKNMNKILWIKKLAVLLQSDFYGKET